MSYKQESTDFVTYLKTNFALCPVDWENSPSGELARPYIRANIISANIEEFSMRDDSIEYPGILSLDVVADEGKGVNASLVIVDALLALFTNTAIGANIRTSHPYRTLLGADNGRYLINVTIPFVRVQYRS